MIMIPSSLRPAARLLLVASLLSSGSALQAATFTVTKTTDAGPGSLRQAILDATAAAGPDRVTFSSALNGKTIILADQIRITDTAELEVDASNLSKGLTIDGGPGTNRIFLLDIVNTKLSLRRLTLTGGGGAGGPPGIDGNGGAIYNTQGRLELWQCTFTGNTASDGGAIFNIQGRLELWQCTFTGNTASHGGAVASLNPTASATRFTTLTQCTFSGNTAVIGGGALYNVNGTTTLIHCTLTDNTALAGEGSGVASYGDSATETIVEGCVIAGNSSGNVDLVEDTSNNSFTSRGGNVIGAGDATADFNQPRDLINVAAPLLGPLANNGGPTQTHALQVGSPAVGRAAGSLVTTDQRGVAIIGMPDAGAFELDPGPLLVTTPNDDGTGSLRQALRDAEATPGPDVIRFSPKLNGAKIVLADLLNVTDPVDVAVDAASLSKGITVDGGPGANRVFLVNPGAVLSARALTVTGGAAVGSGGGVLTEGSLTLRQCTITGNSATSGGGGIASPADSMLLMDHCTVSGNTAAFGGGILARGRVTLNHCTITNNAGSGGGTGGIVIETQTTRLINTLIASNIGTSSTDVGGVGATVLRAGVNIIGSLGISYGAQFPVGLPNGNGDYVGDNTSPAAAPLEALADNGGPTWTHALQGGNPALDAATTSTSTADQRGLPIAGSAPDVGAFEAQPGGFFAFETSGDRVNEGSSQSFTVRRMGGLSGPASVKIAAVNGSAKSPADYSPFPAQTLDFADGEDAKVLSVSTLADADAEPNETFFLQLSSPSRGSKLGTLKRMAITIVDSINNSPANDLFYPDVAFTSPAPGAQVGSPITVSGIASDNQGVESVSLLLIPAGGGGSVPLPDATLESPGATRTKWTATFASPVSGPVTIRATVSDFVDPGDLPAERTFNVLSPLTVLITGDGSVTRGFSPESQRQVGRPYTLVATPGRGALFAGWVILSSHTMAELGIPAGGLEQPKLTVIHRDGLALQAVFAANPYLVADTIGTFNGCITASTTLPDRAPLGSSAGEDGTAKGLATVGYASFRVLSSGGFSGSILIDGTALRVSGKFDAAGQARFGRSGVTTLSVPRPDKPSLSLALNLNTGTGQIGGTLWQFEDGALVAASDLAADRAPFSARNPVPPALLGPGGATALYSTVSQVGGPLPGAILAPYQYPPGFGVAQTKITRTGGVTMVGLLADGTPFAASTTLSGGHAFCIFAQLYKKQGLLHAAFVVNLNVSFSDFSADGGVWIRPVQDTQHYPLGWQDGLGLDWYGCKYTVTPGSSVVPGLPASDANGNANLEFIDNLGFTSTLTVGIDAADRVTNLPADTSFKFTINRSTGLVTGFFTAPDGTKPTFRGTLFQKNTNQRKVFGFYLSATPRVKDYLGRAGFMLLSVQ